MATVKVFPVDAVIVRVQLLLAPVAALTYGLGGEPAAVGIDLSTPLRAVGDAVE